MVSTVPPGQASTGVAWLLRSLVERVPHVRGAVLLSSDGLTKSIHGLGPDEADQLAAIASGFVALARSTGVRFGSSDRVRQVVAELDDTVLFVSSAGLGSVLTVLAERDADPGVVGYEMSQLIKSVRPFLATPARQAAHYPPKP
ncbi:roadblock/LC7 domain-containing protein [Actinoallomurus bryophytorum]|uniref:Putative regulator of Ras-like GTPase activity (Roadblock/LC7/MglB family) n=1 Tax=Actinoallomurus bryophytorum TaxID=1490222 RepID=A0A543CJ34_9ACTN|nr:roadblock/LC7 domain-containing protein [Actinoallomurus bryophytorum]TQL97095.1 putative regulator of Ras-like GTPase activity (Roadblock/LC7/MglB family) [Actinoallomurus bryophytorum]